MKHLLSGQSFLADWRTIEGGSFAAEPNETFNVAMHRALPIDSHSLGIGFGWARSVP